MGYTVDEISKLLEGTKFELWDRGVKIDKEDVAFITYGYDRSHPRDHYRQHDPY